MIERRLGILVVLVLAGVTSYPVLSQDLGPIGSSPYDVVEGWLKPYADEGFAFGGNSGVFVESLDRIFILQRGETRLPEPVPTGFAGWAGSIGLNVLREPNRVWKNCIIVVDSTGNVLEVWDQWNHLFDGADGPGPHRIRISPYDPEHRVWVINETLNQIFVFSNDGRELVMTLGEKNVAGSDETHFGRPQDVAFLPDGRVLVADGLDNHRIVILDGAGNYLSEFGTFGNGPGEFNGVHAVAIGPDDRIFALDRSGGRVQVFRVTGERNGLNQSGIEWVDVWDGFGLPLDLVVNQEHVWVSDLRPLKFVKLDFAGNRLYTWNLPTEGAVRFNEVHAFSVDSEGNMYGADNQLGRTQKLVPKADVHQDLIIGRPFVAKSR